MDKEILQHFGVPDAELLGEGVEARVYVLDGERVLRVYKPGREVPHEQLVKLQHFYQSLDESNVPFKIPDVLSVEQIGNTVCAIDKRIYGQELNEALGHLEGEERTHALLSYIKTAEQIQQLHPSYDYYGEILAENPLRKPSWVTYVASKMRHDYNRAKAMFDTKVPGISSILQFMRDETAAIADIKQSKLVHGDYYVLNVLLDKHHNVSGVMDFNTLTLAGDPRMDLVGAVIFIFDCDGNARPEDGRILLDYLIESYGEEIKRVIHLYRLYHAVHFASFCRTSSPTFDWSIKSLQEHLNQSYSY